MVLVCVCVCERSSFAVGHLIPTVSLLPVPQRLSELERLGALGTPGSVGLSAGDAAPLGDADFTLSFLDDFVADEIERGCEPYRTEALRNLPTGLGKGE